MEELYEVKKQGLANVVFKSLNSNAFWPVKRFVLDSYYGLKVETFKPERFGVTISHYASILAFFASHL